MSSQQSNTTPNLFAGKANTILDFLRQLYPNGPWVLTAIVPDGSTETKTLQPDTEAKLRAFVEKYDGKRNIYYLVNEPKAPLSSPDNDFGGDRSRAAMHAACELR